MKALAILLWAAFAALVVTIGAVLLPACGLLAPLSTIVPGTGWNFCAPSPAALAGATNETLSRRAQQLQLEVARQTLACLTMSGPPRQPAGPASPRPPATEIAKPATPQPSVTPPTAGVAGMPAPTGDYAFLKGCWQSDPFRHSTTEPMGLSTYCFDENGVGELEFRRVDQTDYSCRLIARANAQGEQVRLQDSDGRCNDGTPWYADNLECTRGTGDITECRGTSATPNGNGSFALRLHRIK